MNKVILLGNVGKDGEHGVTTNGRDYLKFTLATNESYKDNTGTWQNSVEWHKIIVWGNYAKSLINKIKKGMQLMIDGKIKTRSWQDDKQQTHYMTEIHVSNIVFCGESRGQGSYNSQNNQLQDEDCPF